MQISMKWIRAAVVVVMITQSLVKSQVRRAVVVVVMITQSLVKSQLNVACSVTELPALSGSLDCRVNNQHTTAQEVSHGGTCTFLCSGSVSAAWRQCHDGVWHGDDGKCREGDIKASLIKVLVRERRSQFSVKQDTRRNRTCWLFPCPHPRDETSPTIHGCPADIYAIADPIQTHTQVRWVEPTAEDEEDGKIRISLDGQPPGRLFSENKSSIRYRAQDSAGNMAMCSFSVNVKVIRCTPAPPRVNNGYRICHVSTDYRLGTVCRYGCYEGHILTGSSSSIIECLKTGHWSDIFPTCKKIVCRGLVESPDMKFDCSNKWKFRSICTYSCTQPGYDIPPGRRRSRTCQSNGKWSGNDVTCIDMEPPKFMAYLHVIAFADRGTNSTIVTFSPPTVMDNSPSAIIPVQTRGQTSGSTFSVGIHPIEFDAVDDAGNRAKRLKFKIIVKEIVCHTLYRTPYQTVQCRQGYRYGSPCYLYCDEDFQLDGTANVTCEKKEKPLYLYGAWSFGSQQPECKLLEQCPALSAPDNGAFLCDTWFGGQFCQLQCRNGTHIPTAFPRWELFQCGNSGIWGLQEFDLANKIPDCTRPTPAKKTKVKMGMTYNSNQDCQSNISIKDLLKNLGRMKLSLVSIKKKCSKTRRRKRAVSSSTWNVELTFSYDLQDSTDQLEVINWLSAVTEGVKDAAKIGLTTDDGHQLSLTGVDNGRLSLTCQRGYLPKYSTLKCDPCDKGSFHNLSSNTCNLCPKGEYQDTEAQTSCVSCPSGYTTSGTGAADSGYCRESCPPGQVSRTGIVPCSPCELSTYQATAGQTMCVFCPGSMTTISQGAASVSECAEFDIDLEPHNTSVAQASLELDGLGIRLGDGSVISWWMRVRHSEQIQLLTFLDNTFIEWLVITVNNSSHIAVNSEYNINASITDNRWHFLRVDINNTELTVSVDDVVGMRRPRRLTQWNRRVHHIIIGGDSFIGSVSQFNIWSDGQLLPAERTCSSNLTGDKLSWQQFVDANLTEAAISLPSECDDFDECSSDPCHHGTCSDELHSFDCDCDDGYEGILCESNIDDCLENVCENNGTCVDHVGGFTCNCTDRNTGDLCEIAVVHGGWGTWDDWSPCSFSCGSGIKTRKRSCSFPSPDNGGRECEGLDTHTEVCKLPSCPSCKELLPPAHGFLSCEKSTALINCTMHCEEGYLPDIEPLSLYYCSEQTSYIWNFETELNPNRRLPVCSKSQEADILTATYHTQYRDLRCDEDGTATSIVRDLVTDVLQSDIQCVRDSKCSVDDVNVACPDSAQRNRRDVSSSNMAFTVTLKNNAASSETAALLESAMYRLQDNANDGVFTVNISDVLYHVDVNQSDIYGDVTCPEGMASYSHLCVPCGQGSFLSHGICLLCGQGSYQNVTGQTHCEQCPPGWTTDGIGSRDPSDCSVEKLQTHSVIVIPVTVSVAVFLTADVIIILVLAKRLSRRKG